MAYGLKASSCDPLRRLSESLTLIGSAMFGATFNLVAPVGLPFFLIVKDRSLQI